MGFFKVQDKQNPNQERRLYTLYLFKHKKNNLENATMKVEKQNQEQHQYNPIHKADEQ